MGVAMRVAASNITVRALLKEVRMIRLIGALILVLLIAAPSWAQQSLVGTYKLVSVQREIDGKADPMTGNPPRVVI